MVIRLVEQLFFSLALVTVSSVVSLVGDTVCYSSRRNPFRSSLRLRSVGQGEGRELDSRVVERRVGILFPLLVRDQLELRERSRLFSSPALTTYTWMRQKRWKKDEERKGHGASEDRKANRETSPGRAKLIE